jgi:hypothetical protein
MGWSPGTCPATSVTWSEGCPPRGARLVTVSFRSDLYPDWYRPTTALTTCPALREGGGTANTGELVDTQCFPTTSAGINRAIAWVARRTGADPATLWVIEGAASCKGRCWLVPSLAPVARLRGWMPTPITVLVSPTTLMRNGSEGSCSRWTSDNCAVLGSTAGFVQPCGSCSLTERPRPGPRLPRYRVRVPALKSCPFPLLGQKRSGSPNGLLNSTRTCPSTSNKPAPTCQKEKPKDVPSRKSAGASNGASPATSTESATHKPTPTPPLTNMEGSPRHPPHLPQSTAEPSPRVALPSNPQPSTTAGTTQKSPPSVPHAAEPGRVRKTGAACVTYAPAIVLAMSVELSPKRRSTRATTASATRVSSNMMVETAAISGRNDTFKELKM